MQNSSLRKRNHMHNKFKPNTAVCLVSDAYVKWGGYCAWEVSRDVSERCNAMLDFLT